MSVKKGSLMKRSQAGFTLLEMMIVVAIMGILVGLIAPNLFQQMARAEIRVAESDLKTISTQSKFYYLDNGELPKNMRHLTPKYIPNNPFDPWGREYKFKRIEGRGVVAFTLGADGKQGGKGADKDRYQKINLRGNRNQ